MVESSLVLENTLSWKRGVFWRDVNPLKNRLYPQVWLLHRACSLHALVALSRCCTNQSLHNTSASSCASSCYASFCFVHCVVWTLYRSEQHSCSNGARDTGTEATHPSGPPASGGPAARTASTRGGRETANAHLTRHSEPSTLIPTHPHKANAKKAANEVDPGPWVLHPTPCTR